jgi:hypothetical protein
MNNALFSIIVKFFGFFVKHFRASLEIDAKGKFPKGDELCSVNYREGIPSQWVILIILMINF